MYNALLSFANMCDLTLKKTNLLILKGVFPGDFFNFDTIYLAQKTPGEPKNEHATIYTKIPKVFVNVDNWPKVSNLKCWNCDQILQSYPRFLPVNPERDKEGNEICDTVGNFCEWNCVVRYAMEKYSGERLWDILKLTNIIAAKFTGRRREKILPSPEKTIMKQYCGDEGITPKQYKEKIDQLNLEYDLIHFRLDQFGNHGSTSL